MKISLGIKLKDGPWGGGNQFGKVLADFLVRQGHSVSFDLSDPALDIVMLLEPDRRLATSAYDHSDVLRYILFRNPNALVIHRINNTSEARDDPDKVFNKFRINANLCADHTVFVSDWCRKRYEACGFNRECVNVILNGGNKDLWYPSTAPRRPGPLRIVTHHWSDNPKKGHDIYARLDALLSQPEWASRCECIYIGNVPKGTKFNSIKLLPPISGMALADRLRDNDIYLTASINESNGNHHIEGALCGLPLLYRLSGGIPDYCRGFGIGFTEDDFELRLDQILTEFLCIKQRMPDYPNTSESMCHSYLSLMQRMVFEREAIKARRPWKRKPFWLVRTLYHV
ncbi:conserved hypothetical protein [Rhodospirillaceae bacterium LM-1]|nr:conserved hypothetical protein [Rhodospirillaceae bacterium LM-1]